jgi:uroporphyrinogen decarboxylase
MVSTGADALHFGNAITMADNIAKAPPDMLVCGNLDPSALFRMGTPDDVEAATTTLLAAMRPWPNFVLSSGCDIPPGTPLANLDRFFATVARFNAEG